MGYNLDEKLKKRFFLHALSKKCSTLKWMFYLVSQTDKISIWHAGIQSTGYDLTQHHKWIFFWNLPGRKYMRNSEVPVQLLFLCVAVSNGYYLLTAVHLYGFGQVVSEKITMINGCSSTEYLLETCGHILQLFQAIFTGSDFPMSRGSGLWLTESGRGSGLWLTESGNLI